jgi:hypothetical protein
MENVSTRSGKTTQCIAVLNRYAFSAFRSFEQPQVANSDGRQLRYFLLDQRLSDKSPLRLAMDDNKNNHRAEIEVGLRLMRQPSWR